MDNTRCVDYLNCTLFQIEKYSDLEISSEFFSVWCMLNVQGQFNDSLIRPEGWLFSVELVIVYISDYICWWADLIKLHGIISAGIKTSSRKKEILPLPSFTTDCLKCHVWYRGIDVQCAIVRELRKLDMVDEHDIHWMQLVHMVAN